MNRGVVLQWTFVAALLLLLAGGCGDRGRNVPTTGGDTPEETFKNLQAAAAKGDCLAMMSNSTEESQELFAAQMAGMVAMTQALAGFSPEAAENAKALQGVLDKHGLTKERLKSLEPDPNSKDPMGDLRKTARVIEDRGQFVADIVAVLKQMPDGKFKLGPDETAVLKTVTISGDEATGTAEVEFHDGKRDMPVQFKKVNGKWLADMTGLMMRLLESESGSVKEGQ